MSSYRKFHHSKFDSLDEREKTTFVSKCIIMWFNSHNRYYKLTGMTSDHKLTQHFVKLEDFYDAIQSILSSVGLNILDFPKFKKDIFLSEKAKKNLRDRIFMADFNRYLDQLMTAVFDRLVLEKQKGVSAIQDSVVNVVEEARAKAFAMADSDDLWS